jgi:membrane protease YdiL (CAAX protease family)
VSKKRTIVEIALVLGLSVGMSALYSAVSITRRVLSETPLQEQTATINRPLAPEPLFDVIYQLLAIASALMPVALVLFLVATPRAPRFHTIGLDGSQPVKDGLSGLGLAALIGIPGLGLYVLGVWWGVTVQIIPTVLDTWWWTIPILLMHAVKAALVEEIIAVGYFMSRLLTLNIPIALIVVAHAVLRASYHLYQGFGPFFGNFVMGLVFAWWFLKTRRLAPLIVAHFAIDAVAFVGYPLWAENAPDFLTFSV